MMGNPDCFYCKYCVNVNGVDMCELNCGIYKRSVYCTLYERSWSKILFFYIFYFVLLGFVLWVVGVLLGVL